MKADVIRAGVVRADVMRANVIRAAGVGTYFVPSLKTET